MKEFKKIGLIAVRLCAPILVVLWLTSAVHAMTYFYVDPDYAGGDSDGSSSKPWTRCDQTTQWNAIDAALASDDVTVYFSAREASSGTNETTNTGIRVLRADTSTNRVILDGMSRFNTNDSNPSWAEYAGSGKFTVTPSEGGSLTPIASFGYTKRNYVTIRGFNVEARSGQCVYYWGGDYVVIEYVEATHESGSSSGPGIYFEYATFGVRTTPGPCTDITIQYCTVHDTYGEGIYVGGGEDSGNPGHSNILIQYNTVYDPASRGGEPDCMETKDGSSNVTFRGNVCYMTTPNTGRDGIGVESAALIEGNFIYNMGRNGVTLSEYWDTATGCRNGAVIRNNIIVNCGGNPSYSWDVGIMVNAVFGDDDWANTKICNNTIYGQNTLYGIALGGGTNFEVINNIVSNADGIEFYAAAECTFAERNNNNYYDDAGTVYQYGGATIAYNGDITTQELDSMIADPEFADTGLPYSANNFQVLITSQCVDSGATLAGFSNDYGNTLRPQGLGWDIGAFELPTGAEALLPPTGLRIVNVE